MTTRSAAIVAPVSAGTVDLDVYRTIGEHQQHGLPRLRTLIREVPVREGENGEYETLECSEVFIGNDDQLYIVHFRDSYSRQRFGRRSLVSEECKIIYQGKQIGEAVALMNEQLDNANKQASSFSEEVSGVKIAGTTAYTRYFDRPFTVDELIGKLNKLIPKREEDPRKRVEKHFDLSI